MSHNYRMTAKSNTAINIKPKPYIDKLMTISNAAYTNAIDALFTYQVLKDPQNPHNKSFAAWYQHKPFTVIDIQSEIFSEFSYYLYASGHKVFIGHLPNQMYPHLIEVFIESIALFAEWGSEVNILAKPEGESQLCSISSISYKPVGFQSHIINQDIIKIAEDSDQIPNRNYSIGLAEKGNFLSAAIVDEDAVNDILKATLALLTKE